MRPQIRCRRVTLLRHRPTGGPASPLTVKTMRELRQDGSSYQMFVYRRFRKSALHGPKYICTNDHIYDTIIGALHASARSLTIRQSGFS